MGTWKGLTASGLATAAVLLLSGCGGSDTTATDTTATNTAPAAAPTTEASTPAAPQTSAGGADPAAVSFPMPSVIGMDLQSAQNLMQDNGVFFSVSHDLLGSRKQVLDSNWAVCTQSVPAGEQVTGNVEGQIDFGVVKREESCP